MKNTNTNPTRVGHSALASKAVQAGVRFGAPSQNCSGNGICNVVPLNDRVTNMPCQCNTSVWISRPSSASLEFKFITAELKPCLRKKYFSEDTFVMQEDTFLPLFVQKALDLEQVKIPSGHYPVQRSSMYTWISFPLVHAGEKELTLVGVNAFQGE